MNKFKKTIAALFAIAIMISAMPISANAAVKISSTNKTISVGKSFTLKITGAKSKVKWSSSNKSVATVTQSGKVTGKQEGSATIRAKVGNRTFSCWVTVKSNFSASEAVKNISCELQDTGRGVVAILKNNNKVAVNVSAKLAYFSGGTMISTGSDGNSGLESGAECALFFHAPYNGDFKRVEYDDYKITMSVEESKYMVFAANEIECNSSVGADCVTAEVKNNSGIKLSAIAISCVFYDSSNSAIGYECNYASCEEGGSVDYMKFDFPYDGEYNTVRPASYKIYVNRAYSYSW